MCKWLGRVTAKYRWFAIVYLVFMFFLLPGVVLGLSLAGTVPFVVVVSVTAAVLATVAVINALQAKKPEWLPAKLRSWAFLPKWMRSLEPVDNVITSVCCTCCKANNAVSYDEVKQAFFVGFEK